MIKLVIFDIDGTLVDSDAALARTVQKVFAQYKLKPPEEELALRFVGNVEEKWIEILSKETGQQEKTNEIGFEEMGAAFRKAYIGFYFPVLAKESSGATDALKKLREKGIKTALATNGRHAFAQKVLAQFNWHECFDATLSADEVASPKPAPDQLNELMARFNCNANETLFVGDTQIDAETAKNAGTHFAIVSRKRNRRVKAKNRLTSLNELPKLAERLSEQENKLI